MNGSLRENVYQSTDLHGYIFEPVLWDIHACELSKFSNFRRKMRQLIVVQPELRQGWQRTDVWRLQKNWN